MSIGRPNGDVRVVPSILAADFVRLGESLRRIESEADWIQIDVMDGQFVPNLTFGPGIVAALDRETGLPLDAHLMIVKPWNFISSFAAAGADLITVHLEACPRPREVLGSIRRRGLKAGLAVKPKTPLSGALACLPFLDLLLIMTVEPGFGGQAFLSGVLPKIRAARREIQSRRLRVWLQVDGGINVSTAALAASAGADSLVAGSAIFKSRNPLAAIRSLRRAASSNRRHGEKTWQL